MCVCVNLCVCMHTYWDLPDLTNISPIGIPPPITFYRSTYRKKVYNIYIYIYIK